MQPFIFTADLHLKMWDDNRVDDDGISLKLIEIINSIDQMCSYASNNDIPNIIIGGDINHTKGTVNVRSFIRFQKLIRKYSNLNFIIIPGNHDMSNRNSTDWAVELFDGYDHVHIHTKPTDLFDDIRLVPWMENGIHDEIKNTNKRVFISHFGLSEASLSSGISIRTNISSKSLRKFDLVLLGHYHKPQTIDNIYYVGSPVPTRRDEMGEEKRFLVVDENFNVTSIPTEGYRKYIAVDLNDGDNIKEKVKEISDLSKKGFKVVLNNRLKNIPEDIKKTDVSIIDLYEEETMVRGISANMKVEDQFVKWLEIENIPLSERDEYIATIIEALGV